MEHDIVYRVINFGIRNNNHFYLKPYFLDLNNGRCLKYNNHKENSFNMPCRKVIFCT